MTLLTGRPPFKYHVGHCLADSPKDVNQKHYVNPSDSEFIAALDWLQM